MALGVPFEHRDERRRGLGRGDLALGHERDHVGRLRAVRDARRAQDRAHQIARRPRLGQRRVGQPHAERLLDAQPELDAGEAVDAEVALELAVERRHDRRASRRRRLGDQRRDDLQHAARELVRVRRGVGWGLRSRGGGLHAAM